MERGAILRIFRAKGQFSLISMFQTAASLAAGLYVLDALPHCSGKPWAVPSCFPVVCQPLAVGQGSTQVSEEC